MQSGRCPSMTLSTRGPASANTRFSPWKRGEGWGEGFGIADFFLALNRHPSLCLQRERRDGIDGLLSPKNQVMRIAHHLNLTERELIGGIIRSFQVLRAIAASGDDARPF